MKGLEALVCECVLAGEKAGVIETVLDSLDDSYPGFDWRKRSAYMLERVMTHGIRRAAEMREVALTVDLLGLKGEMSRASVYWEQTIGELGLRATERKPPTTGFWPIGFSPRSILERPVEAYKGRSFASSPERLTSPRF